LVRPRRQPDENVTVQRSNAAEPRRRRSSSAPPGHGKAPPPHSLRNESDRSWKPGRESEEHCHGAGGSVLQLRARVPSATRSAPANCSPWSAAPCNRP